MLTPSIRKRTLDKIEAYCTSQEIDIEEYINDTLEDAINLALYGDINEKISSKAQIAVKPVAIEEKPETVIDGKAVVTEEVKQPQTEEKVITEPKPQVEEKPKRNKRVRTIASK